jgi:DNA-binding CsgD family transcriptional regulator
LATATPVDASDAILDPMGRIHHLNQAADTASRRTALRAAAVAVERARGPLGRRDSDQALAMWRVMVMGEWTLVDHFERDGKRFLVARRNRPRPRAHRGLSARECEVVSLAALGYSNKLAAYALGLSPSTVVTHFRNACRKLGVRTRAEAVRAWLAASREPVIDST